MIAASSGLPLFGFQWKPHVEENQGMAFGCTVLKQCTGHIALRNIMIILLQQKNNHYADHQLQTSNIGEVVDKKAARSNYWQPQVWAESAVLEMPPFQSIAQFTLSLNLHFLRQFKFLLFFNLYFESLHSVCLSLVCYSGWLLMFTKQIRIQIFSENSSEIHFVWCTARWNIECISLKRLLQQMKSWQFDILWHKQKRSAKSKSLLALADDLNL